MTEPKKPSNRKRRGRGEGSIFQRKDGLWAASITIGYADNGKRRRKDLYGKTKKEVQDKLTALQGQKLEGLLADPQRLTVGQFLDRWLENSVRLSVRDSTHQRYAELVKLHIKPRVGGVQLQRLTALHVQEIYSEMEKAGLSPRMRQFVHTVLRKGLKQAVKWGLVARNVCDAIDRPEVERHEFTPFTAEQTRKFLKAAEGDRLHALYVLSVDAGIRQGEALALRWDDVDLDGGRIAIRRTLREVGGKLLVGEPKTSKSRRTVDISPLAVDALREHRKRMLAEGNVGSVAVFCDTNGGYLRRQNVLRRSFRPLLAAAGLPTIRPHDLRHTNATLLLLAGVHPRVVQERLGHSQIGVTMDTYSHVLPTMNREASDKLHNILKADCG